MTYRHQSTHSAPVLKLLAPFLTLAARTPSKTTFARLQSALFDPLLAFLQEESSSPPSDDDVEEPAHKRARTTRTKYTNILQAAGPIEFTANQTQRAVPGELRRSILRATFDVASRDDARDSNRRKLYAIWREGMAEEENED